MQHRHAITALLELLGRRWALRVLWELRDEPLPYGRLRERCDEVSTSVLADRLKELEAARLIEREAGGAYALSAQGRELSTHLLPLNDFAEMWRRNTGPEGQVP